MTVLHLYTSTVYCSFTERLNMRANRTKRKRKKERSLITMDWARNPYTPIPWGGCIYCHDAYEVHAAILWGIHTCVRAVHTGCKTGEGSAILICRSENTTTYLQVGSALPTGGAPHAIFRPRQNKQAIADLRRALRFVDGNFNTPCRAWPLGFGANDAGGPSGSTKTPAPGHSEEPHNLHPPSCSSFIVKIFVSSEPILVCSTCTRWPEAWSGVTNERMAASKSHDVEPAMQRNFKAANGLFSPRFSHSAACNAPKMLVMSPPSRENFSMPLNEWISSGQCSLSALPCPLVDCVVLMRRSVTPPKRKPEVENWPQI